MIRRPSERHTIRPWWRRVPRRLTLATAIMGGLVAGKLAVQLAIQLRPRITPPRLAFLLHSRVRWRLRGLNGTLGPMALQHGLRVLEVGGGTGALTLPLAAKVAPDGSVFSIDLQAGMLRRQRQRVAASGMRNIHLHRADALALPWAGAQFDRAIMVAVLPMLPDKQRALRELRRVLKPGGLLVVSEELLEPEYVPPAVTRRWCRRAGFEEAGSYREPWFYTLVFRNPPAVDISDAPAPVAARRRSARRR